MRKTVLAVSLCALLAPMAAIAQEQPVVAPGPPIPGATISSEQVPVTGLAPGIQAPGPATMLYPVKSANIRAGAGKSYNVIGKLTQNQPVQIVGRVPGSPDWYQLAAGGFVSASILSPTPVAVAPMHHRPITVPPPSSAYYPVGACEPYSRVVNIAGQPHQIDGTACKEPDGSWRIVNYGVPTPAPGAIVNATPIAPPPPVPVYVQPAPIYVAPPPPPIYYEHRHDPYYRY